MAEREHANCPTCVCGRRAPVQADHVGRSGDGSGPGTISWAEHEQAWRKYAGRHGAGQSAERIAERGGFGYAELQLFLGHDPETWTPVERR